ncbi:MAG: acetyl-CoA carboxylase biotin carboxyl carrier protein [Armatimonadetes bacterium]|nr:acetyl-CoA carboxylase biotin carboxyl carrier protein [Armatimonadota bacterium]
MDFEQVREVVRIAEESGVAELEVETPTLKVRVRKAAAAPVNVQAQGAGAAAAPPGQATALPAAPAVSEDHLVPIVAPMVGTFYRAPSPEAAPFIKEGDFVEQGQVVCIIEAMKLFNEIQADTSGHLARVLVENASPVEYGQPLFLVEPAARRG